MQKTRSCIRDETRVPMVMIHVLFVPTYYLKQVLSERFNVIIIFQEHFIDT